MRESGYGLPLSRLGCLVMKEEKERAWFIRLETNELYEFDRINNKTKVLEHFTDEPVGENLLYQAVEKVDNTLVLGPGATSHVVFYDLADGVCEYRELVLVENDRKVKRTGACDFYKSYAHGNSVYLFGYEYPAILKIDVDTRETVYLTDWVIEVEKRISRMSASMGYVSDFVIVDNSLWALCECANAVLRLDLHTDKIEVMDISSDLDIQCGICFDGNFWVAGNNEHSNKLLKYDTQFVLEKEIEIYSAKDSDEDYDFSIKKSYWATYPVIDLGEKMLLFSVYPCHAYEFDKVSEQARIHPVFEELIKDRDERLYGLKILAPRRKGDFIYFVTGNDFMWNEYDFVRNILTRYEVREECDEGVLKEYSNALAGKIVVEDSFVWDLRYKLTLSRFLKHMKYVSLNDCSALWKNNNVGDRIHKECWEELDI